MRETAAAAKKEKEFMRKERRGNGSDTVRKSGCGKD